MPPKGQAIQDVFLNKLRIKKIPVRIYLINGVKLEGLIESFDQYAISLKSNLPQMIYKHAISTIMPTRNFNNDTTEQISSPSNKIGHDPYNNWLSDDDK